MLYRRSINLNILVETRHAKGVEIFKATVITPSKIILEIEALTESEAVGKVLLQLSQVVRHTEEVL